MINIDILKGEIDELRSPVYPSILKFITTLSDNEDEWHKNITLFQEIVSIISVVVLYMTLKKEFKNQSVNYFVTMLYGCLPAIFTYNRVILTESLSISFFTMYFCIIIKYLKEPTNIKTICLGLFTLFLILLRPSFIYLTVLLTIIFVLIFIIKKENRKQALLGGVVLLGIICAILGYCYLNKKQNNIFAISNVTQINQLDTVIEMGIYDTGEKQDEGIVEIINQRLDGFESTWYRQTTNKIMEEYTSDEIAGYLKRCIKNNFGTYLVKTIEKILIISLEPADVIYLEENGTFDIIKPMIYFIIIYLYILFEITYVLVKIFKNKHIPLVQSIMLITILGQLATIILGAQAEYSRLFITALPIVMLSIAWHIEEVLVYNSTKKVKEIK